MHYMYSLHNRLSFDWAGLNRLDVQGIAIVVTGNLAGAVVQYAQFISVIPDARSRICADEKFFGDRASSC